MLLPKFSCNCLFYSLKTENSLNATAAVVMSTNEESETIQLSQIYKLSWPLVQSLWILQFLIHQDIIIAATPHPKDFHIPIRKHRNYQSQNRRICRYGE